MRKAIVLSLLMLCAAMSAFAQRAPEPDVASTDKEARHYLGSDYPFVIEDLSLGSVREHINRCRGEYGTSTWKSALETMIAVATQSNRQYVERELRVILSAIW